MKADYIHQDTRTLSNTITGEIQTLSRWQDPTIEEYKKEIERLNKDLDTSIEICNKRQKEIVRLNNIINELEKDIKDELKRYNRQKYLKNPAKSKLAEFKEEAFDYMLYKLKELKGSGK